jgi:hypothetical protein
LVASPVARENPLKALIFLDFLLGLAATRQTDPVPLARPRRAAYAFSWQVFLFKTAA